MVFVYAYIELLWHVAECIEVNDSSRMDVNARTQFFSPYTLTSPKAVNFSFRGDSHSNISQWKLNISSLSVVSLSIYYCSHSLSYVTAEIQTLALISHFRELRDSPRFKESQTRLNEWLAVMRCSFIALLNHTLSCAQCIR